MCLILFALELHPRHRLVLAANRDEHHERPTAPAGWWDDAPGVLAGRDLRGGGTWLGVTRAGRWSALTNVRTPAAVRGAGAPSRGELVRGFLEGEEPPRAYARRLMARMAEYEGFNLLLGDTAEVVWLSNRGGEPPRTLGPGVYGLSNHLLDTPWPKVERGKGAMAELLERSRTGVDPEALLALLRHRDPPPDAALPDTGVGLELERALAPAFIVTPGYGTRASTALLADRDGGIRFVERTYGPGGTEGEERRFAFEVEG